MDHHDFSPSRLEQFRLCPGSYFMQKDIPEVDGEWSKEGKLLHKAIETGNNDCLSDDQIAIVEDCRAFALSLTKSPDAIIKQEQTFEIKDEEGVLTYGTADYVIIDNGTLTVIDWKFGYNPVNDVKENIQLATYALGAMLKYGIASCDCWVYQPRIHKKSHHVFTNASAIMANIKAIIKRAQSENLSLKPSDSACRYCKARLNCPAFRLKFQRLNACKGSYDLSDITTLTSLYEASKVVKGFINEVESAVKKIIEENGRCGKFIFQVAEGPREIKDLNALYSVVKDYLTTAEFNSLCKVSLGRLETALSEKLIAEAKVSGEKMTKTEAKSKCYTMIADLISRGAQTKKIVEVA